MVKLDNIGKPTGQDKYWICSASITILLNGIKAYDSVVDGLSLAEDADTTDVDTHTHLGHSSSIIFMQVTWTVILGGDFPPWKTPRDVDLASH
jgi:hypothetical protein